jgi:hypothetical protein
VLQQQNRDLIMRESAVFAWIPTLTSVSRQAIFSGRPPFYFPASIYSTNHEEKLWKKFWEECGLSRMDVSYQRGLGDGDIASVLDAAIHPGSTRVAESFAFAQKWPSTGLPAHYFPLVAEGRDAFATPGHTIVAHGGAAIEEVIVPLVKIERKTR